MLIITGTISQKCFRLFGLIVLQHSWGTCIFSLIIHLENLSPIVYIDLPALDLPAFFFFFLRATLYSLVCRDHPVCNQSTIAWYFGCF